MPSRPAPRRSESREPTYLEQQVENLRLRLLDLSRRNPLVSTKDGERYHSLLRVVDELPDELLTRVSEGTMEFLALPSLEQDPKDENTVAFKNALAEARRTDREYLEAPRPGALFAFSDDAEDESRIRALKDRVRERLGMSPRQSRGSLSLQQHAKNNGINPSYELPEPGVPGATADQHRDNFIQTLLFQDELERRLNAIIEKNRSWEAETGVAVLRLALGFLEWVDPADSKISIAPLVLLPVMIERRQGRGGYRYLISTSAENAESNAVIAKKVADEFGVELPRFSAGDTLEGHFVEVASAISAKPAWRVRRRVVVGVFPSQEIAMYEDLDTSSFDFGEREVLDRLINGSTGAGAALFADDQEESLLHDSEKAPLIVTDADSSQLSAVYDVTASGLNMAIEGPPGSGKSQTIVNIIAAALYQSKKVLFVAEKAAALDVVRSRLEAVGLGDFVLSMLPSRSNRKGILDSVRARIDLRAPERTGHLQRSRENLKRHRDAMSEYLNVMSLEFADTGLTVHEILGRAIAARSNSHLDRAELDKYSLALAGMAEVQRTTIREQAREYAELRHEAELAHPRWGRVTRGLESAFAVADVQKCLEDGHRAALAASAGVRELHAQGALTAPDAALLEPAALMLRELISRDGDIDFDVVMKISQVDDREGIDEFIRGVRKLEAGRAGLLGLADRQATRDLPARIRKLHEVLSDNGVEQASAAAWASRRDMINRCARDLDECAAWLVAIEDIYGPSQHVSIAALVAMYDLLDQTSTEALNLRSARTADAPYRHKLDRGLRDLDRAVSELERLHASVPNPAGSPAAQLEALAKAISDRSLLRMLKPSYRRARADATEALGGSLPGAKVAERRLLELARALTAVAASQDEVSELTGGSVDARVPDEVAALRAALNLYEQCDVRLARTSDAQVREIIRSATTAQLVARPPMPTAARSYGEAGLTVHALRGRRDEASSLARAAASLDDEVSSCLQAMRLTHDVATAQLPSLALALERWHVEKDLLAGDPIASALSQPGSNALITDVDRLESHVSLAYISPELLSNERVLLCKCAMSQNRTQILDTVQEVRAYIADLNAALARVTAITGMDPVISEARGDLDGVAQALRELAADESGLVAHTRLQGLRARMTVLSHFSLLEDIGDHTQSAAECDRALGHGIDLARARDVWGEHGRILHEFNGIRLDKIREDIKGTDLELLKVAREELRRRLITTANPPDGNGRGRRSEWTEMALLNNELNKERRLVPPRDLTRRAGGALLALKPCWMMSPLAVAQYTDKTLLEFDLVIIDEASQMTPEHAIGAMARGRQVVVVGDTNQLPPSDFFRKLADDDEEDEDSIDQQSILEWANMTFRPRRRLKWHYRSRHSALIAFSNHHVYGDELVVFPSANEARADMGVRFQRVQGSYVSGSGRAAGTNTAEAAAMVDAVAKFMREEPGRSLGVVVMNKVQKDLLEEEIGNRIASDRAMARYVEQWEAERDGLEPFFVKNLENVQGDERDVIFIGTVYGPTEGARTVRQQFGPVNRTAGKRRLNVLFTRAREQMVTFSSMDANDVGMDDRLNEGRLMLRNWLEYCATGRLPVVRAMGGQAESPFEAHVAERIRALGFEAVPQVGVGKFRIDIGVQHEDYPSGFLIGIECDGASYHSSRSARDRDRLRQEVLEKLGWKLYRIWSTDWFENPVRESQKLAERLQEALADARRARGPRSDSTSAAVRAGGGKVGLARDALGPQVTSPIHPESEPHDPPPPIVSRPSLGTVELTRIRPGALRRIAEHVTFLRHFDRFDQEFLLRVAKERAMDLPLSHREAVRLGRIVERAIEVGMPVDRS